MNPSGGKMWSNWNCHALPVGGWNGTITLENGLAAPFKAKYTLPYDPEIPLLVLYPEVKTYEGGLKKTRIYLLKIVYLFLHV